MNRGTRPLERQGPGLAALNRSPRFWMLVLTCHDRLPLSSPFCERTWLFLASGFCDSEFAAAMDAKPFSGSAAIVIGDRAIAARVAVLKRGCNSTAAPTVGISGVWKAA
jgi:hypothetical protein